MSEIPERPKLSRLFRLQWEETQDNYVLLYPEGMVKLNTSAAEILKRCNGERDIAAIVNDLEITFSATGLQADVEDFMQTAHERGWIR
ncbi:pyrroloquinoline quinone biosynthesis peptide chaperone PqqD [Pollutimonas nitritireducens]|uniref:Pyrroloquinoline quinone biosynthesis peptide chaperone PqqD n=1 Tax=Pollutimonas nitritireducens TaxID=2045209 RepID=A0A2N4UFX2_9BURK|nr:pyrroloquinoline quinone biosynthesis peptide chaperone PqqD [Pollutimonas nitritireducens]PLC53916.1 pyrroloquinoline quinone biosynthesis peptide chaperone PqqD [Pollutimonas nitritireducens]